MLKKFSAPALVLAALVWAVLSLRGADVARIAPAAAAKLVGEGKAILIDVREPAEWFASGVAAPAVLLPQSDFENAQFEWKPFLEKSGKDKTLILYCRSGRRAGMIASQLAEKGYTVANAGGLQQWTDAGLPVRQLETQK